ncbi:MAG: transporter ATP-binding protein [Herminiimonas sp.]|nr:transporter ATP-binding protein [Herminiimonas sp.]MDB5853366.1 transporter ATP-binding protein [Herminiimonas sp.]
MLRTTSLQLAVGARVLVERLDWRVAAGECWCVLGRNGAGKSTLLRTLAGLHEADAGTIALHGRVLTDYSPVDLARLRAFLPQSRHDAFGYCVMDAVLAARHPLHQGRYWESTADHAAAVAALSAMEVQDLAHRDIRSLSGGERQRVAIAAALAQDTPLLMLDEPANALDLAHQVQTMALISRLCRHEGRSVIMVAHDLNLARATATHALLLMGNGGWRAGTVVDIMQDDLLSTCLGHPIESVQVPGRTLFLPVHSVVTEDKA